MSVLANPGASGAGRAGVVNPGAGAITAGAAARPVGGAVIETLVAAFKYMGNNRNDGTTSSGDLAIGTAKLFGGGNFINQDGTSANWIGTSFGVIAGLSAAGDAKGACRGVKANDGAVATDANDPLGGSNGVGSSFTPPRASATQFAKSDAVNDLVLDIQGTLNPDITNIHTVMGVGVQPHPTPDPAALGIEVANFKFTGAAGPYSTGALSFNPKFVLVLGMLRGNANLIGWGWGFNTTATSQYNYMEGHLDNGTHTSGANHAGGGVLRWTFGHDAAVASSLQITTFSKAGGVILTWNSGTPVSATIYVLVVGEGDGGITGLQVDPFEASWVAEGGAKSTPAFGTGLKAIIGVAINFTQNAWRSTALFFATGTGTGARAVSSGQDQLANTGATFSTGADDDAVAGSSTAFNQAGFADGEIDVTTFDTATGQVTFTASKTYNQARVFGVALRDAAA